MLWTVTALATVVLAAGAPPAFTDDSGTVTVTITAQAAPTPCLTVSPGAVDFGTLPFSTPGIPGISSGDSAITSSNCGTAGQNLLASATNASGPSGTWTLGQATGTGNACDDVPPGIDTFFLRVAPQAVDAPFGVLHLSGTPATVPASFGGPPAVFAAGSAHAMQLRLYMPCQGSSGAGEQKTLDVNFTAVVA